MENKQGWSSRIDTTQLATNWRNSMKRVKDICLSGITCLLTLIGIAIYLLPVFICFYFLDISKIIAE